MLLPSAGASSVSLAFPPVGGQRTVEQPAHKTAAGARHRQPSGHFTPGEQDWGSAPGASCVSSPFLKRIEGDPLQEPCSHEEIVTAGKWGLLVYPIQHLRGNLGNPIPSLRRVVSFTPKTEGQVHTVVGKDPRQKAKAGGPLETQAQNPHNTPPAHFNRASPRPGQI